ncbi:MAG: hypothetical protein QF890_01010 [Myxococcota bacterium]|jgi:uncharacterized protein involved in outer membrane biogenesis|nr:hypothetical protein [Deltaproteobacteria bacterium]MCP4244273.1 hypothetical protein [bacterium]MDP6074940.1 hypothetical protein [Myxococcota bacterium]MDP7074289.1 hypothetical protein [Myxococcota bacterium]MDP7300833.1 hypothetical protein [Myxococcota bacterium]
MLRKLILFGAVALVAVCGAVYYFSFSLDGIVARAIERNGSAVTGTTVSVSGVHISLRDAKGSIRGLRIENPKGFSGEAVSFRDITIGIDPASLVSRNPIVLTQVRVQEPSVNLVLDENGRSNLGALQDNLKRPSGSSGATSEGPPTRLGIRRLEIAGTKLSADVSAVGGKNYEMTLSPVNRSNIGGSSGATAGEIAKLIAGDFVQQVVVAVARSEAQHQIDQLIDKKLGGDAVGEAAKSIVDGILGK